MSTFVAWQRVFDKFALEINSGSTGKLLRLESLKFFLDGVDWFAQQCEAALQLLSLLGAKKGVVVIADVPATIHKQSVSWKGEFRNLVLLSREMQVSRHIGAPAHPSQERIVGSSRRAIRCLLEREKRTKPTGCCRHPRAELSEHHHCRGRRFVAAALRRGPDEGAHSVAERHICTCLQRRPRSATFTALGGAADGLGSSLHGGPRSAHFPRREQPPGGTTGRQSGLSRCCPVGIDRDADIDSERDLEGTVRLCGVPSICSPLVSGDRWHNVSGTTSVRRLPFPPLL